MDERTGTFSEGEIREAYAALHQRVQGFADSGDWSGFADCFTEDATYVEHVYGTFHGRAEIRDWCVRTMSSFPGSAMVEFPLSWTVVDVPTSRLICEIGNRMPDPGDGSVHSATNLTIVTYAGDGLFSREEDVYNPMRFLTTTLRWAAIAERHGRLDEAGQAYVAAYGRRGRDDRSGQ
ncbi:nuclear transport factor 2 family protein [Nocardioides sp. dk4132]|uniref:nuclear transport factor 2 family protein n=1 Tax=unclassified Nocardioides TaxID=2615069 RepID=UPI001297BB26|nr:MULTISPECIES: nuclear transport factor 2 family protein [unclassified Nocardioides]MQW77564.1 nuclear transport factor 2 family protein [Nocardioides sp. dk4132]QGA06096.1 nuclear transport factor 2 family protein [Nocardioides sp. dk884]